MPFRSRLSEQARPWSWLFAAGALVWFAVLGVRPLFNPDEGRYAEIPSEMLATGDWIVPHLNGLVYLEKPPLQYWATALSLAVFGHGEWAARFFMAAMALVALGFVFLLARRWWDVERGLLAVAMCGSMLLYVALGQLLTLDMVLGAWLTIAIVAFCLAQAERDTRPTSTRNWMLVCWAAMGLATLTKGLIGIVIPGAVLVIYTALQRDAAAWRHAHIGKGLALYAAIVVPWFVLVERAHPGAFHFLIIREHFERYLTKIHDRYEPWWYFLAILAAGTLPWLPQSARALATGWRARRPAGQFDAERVLWVAAAFILVFFSLSDSKLAPYVVPMLPLLALLGSGRSLGDGRDLRRSAWLVLGLGALLAAGLAYTALRPLGPKQAWMVERLWPWLAVLAIVLLAAGGYALRRRAPFMRAAQALAAAGFAAGLLLIVGGANAVHPKYSGRSLVDAAGALAPDAELYAVRTFDWTVPFYTGRKPIVVEWRGELEYGLGYAPDRAIDSLAEFESRWRAHEDGYAIMKHDLYQELGARGVPMRLLGQDPDLVVVRRR